MSTPPAPTTTSTTTPTNMKAPDTVDPTNYVLVASYATIVALWAASPFVLIPYSVHLLTLVTCILYCACHSSISLLHDDDSVTTTTTDENGNTVTTTTSADRETLRAEDAYQFPLVGSASLFSLYLAFTYLDKDMVNLLIGGYFALVGTVSVTMTIGPMLTALMGKIPGVPTSLTAPIRWESKIHHPFTMFGATSPVDLSMDGGVLDIVSFVLAAIVCGIYLRTKPWYLNNVLGISFCLQGIERFSLGTYKIGAILLVGLFFYDIFWVFGTDVMVTVAKNLDGPIKILFPRTLNVDEVTGKMTDLSLLGLGDIVIPGFFLALLLRFDAHRAPQPVQIHDSFPKPYFHSALFAYVLGLATTIFIMMYFNAAQPALLYLVPACLGSSLLTATVRGELKDLFAYSEEQEEETDADNEEDTVKKDK